MSDSARSDSCSVGDEATFAKPLPVTTDSFEVNAAGELLGGWIAFQLQDDSPGAETKIAQSAEIDAGAIVTHTGTGRWLYLSVSPTPDKTFAQALDRGAASVLSMRATRADFELAIRAVRRESGVYVPPDVVSWLATQSLGREANIGFLQEEVRLTPREHEVLSLILEGQTNHETAKSLMISPNTVRSHLHSLSVKFDASNRARLLHRARELGFGATVDASRIHTARDVPA